MNVKKIKAVIPAAGLGTRFLPVTRVVPKEMLPVGAKPALELIVDEARAAGAEEIVIVVSEGKDLIRRYFESSPDIEFVLQKEQKGLGHAVFQAADKCRSCSQVLVLLGDALVLGCCASREMMALSEVNGSCSVIGFERVSKDKVSRYGIAKPLTPVSGSCRSFELAGLVEKPSVEEAPSDLAVAGRYLLDADIFRFLEDQQAGKGGEIQLTDAIQRMMRENKVMGFAYPGKRLDIGNPEGYFKALEAYYGCNQN